MCQFIAFGLQTDETLKYVLGTNIIFEEANDDRKLFRRKIHGKVPVNFVVKFIVKLVVKSTVNFVIKFVTKSAMGFVAKIAIKVVIK